MLQEDNIKLINNYTIHNPTFNILKEIALLYAWWKGDFLYSLVSLI